MTTFDRHSPLDTELPASSPSRYIGRFAPSPTGPLHFGSLVGALASYLDARHHQGTWLVRIEDIDPLREPPDAAAQILTTLEAHGLLWDGPLLYQSTRGEAYEEAIAKLLATDHAYYCPCSRKQLAEQNGHHAPGCRDHRQSPEDAAIRFKVHGRALQIQDRIQGLLPFAPQAERDDFVLKRKEGFYAYQLAVVVDDAWQGVTDVVRGSDLLDSLPWQHLLQEALGLPHPRYAHIPVITNAQGQKLSKQNRSPALDDRIASDNMRRALSALALTPPPELAGASCEELLHWATPRWSSRLIAAVPSIAEADLMQVSPS